MGVCIIVLLHCSIIVVLCYGIGVQYSLQPRENKQVLLATSRVHSHFALTSAFPYLPITCKCSTFHKYNIYVNHNTKMFQAVHGTKKYLQCYKVMGAASIPAMAVTVQAG